MKTCWITYNLVLGSLIFRGDCVAGMPNGRLTQSFLQDVKSNLKKAVLDNLRQQGTVVPEADNQEVCILACIPLDEEEPNPLVVVPPTGEAWENPNDAL